MADELFFVASPPRGGTAWLSQALMFGGEVFAYHEAERDVCDARDMDDVAERMMDRMRERHQWFVGNVSSGLLAFSQIQAPLVIIHRPWDDVDFSLKAACAEWGIPDYPYDIDKMKDMHDNLCAVNPHAMHIDFEQVFTMEGLTLIWKHCCRLIPPPIENFTESLRHRVTLKDFSYPWIPEEPFGIRSTETVNT